MSRTDRDLLPGVIAFIVTVLVVVAVAAVGAFLAPTGGAIETGGNVSVPAFDDAPVPEELGTGGEVRPDVPAADREGVVLIDNDHGNGFDRKHVAPLSRALAETGHSVRFHGIGDNLTAQLNDAKAFVVMTPATGFSDREVRLIDEFTDRGGRLLLVAEPSQIEIQQGALAAQLIETSDATTTLASAHGVSFDTRYLYNLGTNDGNYKHVIVRSTGAVDGVEQAAVYTGTTVSVRDGTELLVAAEGTRLSGDAERRQYPVAVRQGNTVALGDRTMLRSNRYTVGDNEAVLAHLVEFLAGGRDVSGLETVETGPETGGRTDAGPGL